MLLNISNPARPLQLHNCCQYWW